MEGRISRDPLACHRPVGSEMMDGDEVDPKNELKLQIPSGGRCYRSMEELDEGEAKITERRAKGLSDFNYKKGDEVMVKTHDQNGREIEAKAVVQYDAPYQDGWPVLVTYSNGERFNEWRQEKDMRKAGRCEKKASGFRPGTKIVITDGYSVEGQPMRGFTGRVRQYAPHNELYRIEVKTGGGRKEMWCRSDKFITEAEYFKNKFKLTPMHRPRFKVRDWVHIRHEKSVCLPCQVVTVIPDNDANTTMYKVREEGTTRLHKVNENALCHAYKKSDDVIVLEVTELGTPAKRNVHAKIIQREVVESDIRKLTMYLTDIKDCCGRHTIWRRPEDLEKYVKGKKVEDMAKGKSKGKSKGTTSELETLREEVKSLRSQLSMEVEAKHKERDVIKAAVREEMGVKRELALRYRDIEGLEKRCQEAEAGREKGREVINILLAKLGV